LIDRQSNGDPRDDGELIEAAHDDADAFAELYRRYVGRVYRYLCTYVDRQEDAADLTQMVFLRAMVALPRYRSEGRPFRVWLFRIARNAAIDTARRRRRMVPWDHLPEELHPFAAGDPLEAALEREALNHLRLSVARLDAEKQELLALRFAARLSSREIGLLLDRSEAAIHKQLTRILTGLREEYSRVSE
jgi:RNA polymerase sigma-70 factor (ECF subfamily)